MDTLVYYSIDLSKKPIPADTGKVPMRNAVKSDEQYIREVANEAFVGYFGHYHADKRLDRKKCDETYTSLACRSCVLPDVADQVYVAEMDGAIVGFAAFKFNSAEEGEGVLTGLLPRAQGKGIHRSFIIKGLEWFKSQGRTKISRTDADYQYFVPESLLRLGFEPYRFFYTFHKWFDENNGRYFFYTFQQTLFRRERTRVHRQSDRVRPYFRRRTIH